MRALWGSAALGFATLCLATTVTHDARADVFEDATSVIEQLIEDNIATQAVPNAAGKYPITCDFFPSTIYAIEGKRYTGLPAIIRKEAADAAGFFVLDKLDPSTVATPAAPQAKPLASIATESLSAFHNTTVAAANAKAAGIAARTNNKPISVAGAQVDPSNFPGCTFVGAGGTAPMESIATAALSKCVASQSSAARELACSAALLTRDAANGDDRSLPADLRRLAAALVIAEESVLQNDVAKVSIALSAAFASGNDPGAGVCAALTAPPANCAATLNSLSTLLVARNLRFDVTTLEQAFGVASNVVAVCARASCKQAEVVLASADALMLDVEAKNYGAAVGDIIGDVQQLNCVDSKGQPSTDSKGCSLEDKAVYSFVRALAIFVIDAATSGAPTVSAESDFKQAAVELIERESGQGVRRQLYPWQWAVVPEFAIRDAWWPGHLSSDTSSQLVMYPSIDFVRVRQQIVGQTSTMPIRSRQFYLALHESLLDLLGPIVEGATRDPSLRNSANLGKVAALGFLVPRLDIEFGVPSLTKNIVIGAGTAFRFYRAVGKSGNGVYCMVGETCSAASGKDPSLNNWEGSIFVKYVP